MSLRRPRHSRAVLPGAADATAPPHGAPLKSSSALLLPSRILLWAAAAASPVAVRRYAAERRAVVSRGDPASRAAVRAVATNASSAIDDFGMASRESFGFFADVPQNAWEEMRAETLGRRGRVDHAAGNPPNADLVESPSLWYHRNWDPDFPCHDVERIGRGDGAKWVCHIDRLVSQSRERRADEVTKDRPGCLVYSVGSNGQFGFEEAMIKRLGDACEVHTFDFDDFSHKVPPGSNVRFHKWGLKPSYEEELGVSRDGYGQRAEDDGKRYGLLGKKLAGGTFKTLRETVVELGHAGLPIDVFKIDCEGCEWGTYRDWIGDDVDARQILVEVHSAPEVAPRFFEDVRRAGYVTFHKEMNIQWFWHPWDSLMGRSRFVEYAFLKLDKPYGARD